MITGEPGSGKSTLARALAACTDLPVFHMDHIHYKPGWEQRPHAEKILLSDAVTSQSKWIFEGGMSATYPQRCARADTFVWLDIPVWLRFWRVVARTIRQRGKTRPDMPADCPEQLFTRETFAFWIFIWQTRKSSRAKLAAIAANPGTMTVHHLRSLSQVNTFLDAVRNRP